MIWREEKRRKWESQRYNAFAISRCYEHKNKLVEHLSIWLSLFFLHLYVSRYYKVDDDKKKQPFAGLFFQTICINHTWKTGIHSIQKQMFLLFDLLLGLCSILSLISFLMRYASHAHWIEWRKTNSIQKLAEIVAINPLNCTSKIKNYFGW